MIAEMGLAFLAIPLVVAGIVVLVALTDATWSVEWWERLWD